MCLKIFLTTEKIYARDIPDQNLVVVQLDLSKEDIKRRIENMAHALTCDGKKRRLIKVDSQLCALLMLSVNKAIYHGKKLS